MNSPPTLSSKMNSPPTLSSKMNSPPSIDKVWVGLYVAIASLICTLAMAADVFQGFRRRKLWFPCRFFTINAASITLIGITTKILVDLTTELHGDNDRDVKLISFIFLFTVLANFLPSFGGMGDKELLSNIIALGIFIIPVIVKFFIQESTNGTLVAGVKLFIIIFFFPWPFCVALTAPASRGVLEQQYQKNRPGLDHQKIKFSSKELTRHVTNYWMMVETGNPQFVLASSPFCSASGFLCLVFATISIIFFLNMLFTTPDFGGGDQSDYKWSINVILVVQYFGIVVGSIAPIFRCITTATYFNPSLLWTIQHINMFRVEKHWTESLRQWKHIHVTSCIPGRHCKKVFNHVKNMILNIFIAIQITLVVICKTIRFVPTCIILLVFSCCHFWSSLLKRSKKDSGASNDNVVRSEIDEYKDYVLKIEDEAELTDRTLRNMLRSLMKLLHDSEKKRPTNLINLLEKSPGFKEAVPFQNNQALPFCHGETNNCWSLVAVTLTTIAIAIPNIAKDDVNGLLASMKEGLEFVRHIEDTFNANGDLVNARISARRIWTEAEVYRNWLQIDLQKKDRKGKSSKEILQLLNNEATSILAQSDNRSAVDSPYKIIAASSMKRISQTILDEQKNWPSDEKLFGWISTIIADLLWACFTNLPRVIALKCHHDAIEKRDESIRTAARLLGKSKGILDILERSQLPDLDHESIGYIHKWQAQPMSEIHSSGFQSCPPLDV